jgi:predicted ATP-grasp superfamily ATP-dependent carboligase
VYGGAGGAGGALGPRRHRDLSDPARLLVTDAGRGSAVTIIRSLARRGWHVIAADDNRLAPGLYSRHARGRVRYASPREAPEVFVATLLSLVREHRVDIIVPVTDDVILPLAAARDRFTDGCTVALPSAEALSTAADKRTTLELATRLGVPAPRTCVVQSAAEAVDRAAAFDWPVVLKPVRSKRYEPGRPLESFAVSYAEDVRQLGERVRQLEGRSAILMQEYYRGEAHGVGLLLYEGRPLAAFQHRRLREVPLTGGMSSYRESVRLDPVLYDHAVRLLGALSWTGPALVEFKVGEQGPKLMEINGRVWGSLPLAVKSGVDFPARWLELYRSGPPAPSEPPQTEYAIGVRSRDFALEVAWVAAVLLGRRRYRFEPRPPRSAALGVAWRLLLRADGDDVLSRDDPLPGLLEFLHAARLAVRQLKRRKRRLPAR